MNPESLCFYSVVRYMEDPVRNEPRNIGVIVVCPDSNHSAGRFSLERTGLTSISPRYLFLESTIRGYHLGEVNGGFTLARLRELHEESTNMIQFTQPLPAPGDPEELLGSVFKEFVAPRQ